MSFLPGQVYALAGFDAKASVTVCRVDVSLAEVIVHVRVDGVEVVDGAGEEGMLLMPFSAEALQASVGALLREDGSPGNWESAYEAWQTAYEEGEATVWSLPVYDAIQVMESMASAG
jgi:hypothetical protein